MADCFPFSLPPLTEDEEQRMQCDTELPTGDDARSSSRPTLQSVSSTTSTRSRTAGIVERNLEATAKLRQLREYKEKHRQKLIEEMLSPLDGQKVKR